MLVDFVYSIHIATRIRKFANNLKIVVNLDKFKEYVKNKTYELYFKNQNLKNHCSFFLTFNIVI